MRGLVSAGLMAALLVPGPAAAPAQAQIKSSATAGSEELLLLRVAFERIREEAVDPVNGKKLVGAAIAGMLAGVDPHAAYLDAAALQAAQRPPAAGEAGIGAVVTLADGQLKVISPRDGSPAAAAGLKPGDVILAIDKEPTYELTLSEAERKLRGPAGSQVALLVQRGEGRPLKLALKRAAAPLPTVSARVEDGNLGYLRLSGFDEATPAALAAAVRQLRQGTAGKLAGLVVDLRNNPGGNFQDAVAAADAFLDKGDVAVVKGRAGEPVRHIAATPGDLAKGLPIVALINGGTAAEAELVAGALHDNRRAVLLGTKSYGESAIESLIPIAGGGAIRLTTARFATPDGHEIDAKGIEPDLAVTPLKLDRLTQEDGWLHEADLPGALKNPDQPAARAANSPAANSSAANSPAQPSPRAGSSTTAAVSTRDLGGAEDEQLSEALDMLHGLAITATE